MTIKKKINGGIRLRSKLAFGMSKPNDLKTFFT